MLDGNEAVARIAYLAKPAAFERANYLKVLRSYALRSRPAVG